MAKKTKEKVPLTSLPINLEGISEEGDLSEITRGVNNDNFKILPPPQQQIQKSENKVGHKTEGVGRRRKADESIIVADEDDEWGRFMNYTNQYHKKRFEGKHIIVHVDIKKFFERIKMIYGSDVDVTSMVNAVLRNFMDQFNESVNERIRQELNNN